MTNFFIPRRYDVEQASDGVWTSVIDENDVLWGRFKLRLYDEYSPTHAATLDRLKLEYPKTEDGKPHQHVAAMSGDDFQIFAMVEHCVVDWELKDASGELIEFSTQKAFEYFSHPNVKYAFDKIAAFCSNIRNFQPAEQTELPEGNSSSASSGKSNKARNSQSSGKPRNKKASSVTQQEKPSQNVQS